MLLRPALMYGSGTSVLGVTLREKMKSKGIWAEKQKKESPLLEATAKQWVWEDKADWEDLECAITICRLCRTVTVLYLFLFKYDLGDFH
jgi:hypothetical protein